MTAVGGLLGPKADAYAVGVGGVATGVSLKLSTSIRDFLYKQGQNLGSSLGSAGSYLPGVIAAGAMETGAARSAEFESKYLGMSLTQILLIAGVAVGGLFLWLIRSKR